METTKKKRCPVCGKFATDAMVQKYDALVSENTTLHNHVLLKTDSLTRLKKENSELKQEVEMLHSAKDAALKEVEKLRSRSFIKRLLNK